MAVTAAEQEDYNNKLNNYNIEVGKNQQRNTEIQQHQSKIAELEAKIQRLEDAKTKINNENGQIADAIKGLEKGPNHDQFQGKNENDYWTQKKIPAKDEAYKFLKGINGDGNSVVQQIDKKISELRDNINSENASIKTLKDAITNPVAPTPPSA